MASSEAMSLLYLHAAGGCIAWAVLMPLGAAIRKVTVKARWHAVVMAAAAILVILSFSAGIVVSYNSMDVPLTSAHQVIGLILFPLLVIQAFGGSLNHGIFKKSGKSTFVGTLHRYMGPALITVGTLNGYLGIDFAGDNEYIKPYIITITVWFFVLFTAVAAVRRYRRRGAAGLAHNPTNVVGASEEPASRMPSDNSEKESVA